MEAAGKACHVNCSTVMIDREYTLCPSVSCDDNYTCYQLYRAQWELKTANDRILALLQPSSASYIVETSLSTIADFEAPLPAGLE